MSIDFFSCRGYCKVSNKIINKLKINIMRHLILLMCVVAIAITSCERPTYEPTGVGSVYYKHLKKGDKKLVGLCHREVINGKWKETEELVRPQYDEISQDFVKNSSYFAFSNGDSSYVGTWSGKILLDYARIKKGSVEYLGTNLYNRHCFYPGDVYRMQTMDGKYLYWFDYDFFVWDVDELVPTFCGFMVRVEKGWKPARFLVTRMQVNALQKKVLLKYKSFFDVDYDAVYEVVNKKDWTNFYYMAFKDGQMIVLNSEGQKVSKYPAVISRRLLKTKINNKPNWEELFSQQTYPKRVGVEEAGTIFVKVPRGQWF